MKITFNDSEPFWTISDHIKKEIDEFMEDFENATDNETDPEWMSDGEWLDRALEVIRSICINM